MKVMVEVALALAGGRFEIFVSFVHLCEVLLSYGGTGGTNSQAQSSTVGSVYASNANASSGSGGGSK